MGFSLSDTAAMPTLDEALRHATARLAGAGIPKPRTDAGILLRAAAGIDRVALLRDGHRPLDANALGRFESLIERRLGREPVSRILGRREFWGLDLLVTPDVLDPRPDTETLVQAVLDHIGPDQGRPWRILDLGTGSGAILCALLSELPAALAWGVDRSPAACRVSRENLDRCGFGGRSLVLQGGWAAGLGEEQFDLVVSNPPYIESDAIAGLDIDVRDHDPLAALDGGADGFDAYRAITPQLPALLVPGGAAFLEVGHRQAGVVSGFLDAAGLSPGVVRRDLSGIERVVSARRYLQPAEKPPGSWKKP